MNKTFKATIIHLIVALLIALSLIILVILFFGREIDTVMTLANKITVDTSKKEEEIVKIDLSKQLLETYPEYGTQYADIEIPAIDVNLPVYYGDTLSILKNGVGHSGSSYFPGEGGTIVYMGHNFEGYFRRFGELQVGDKIKITTTYGEYNYEIYDLKLVDETDLDAVDVQREKEILAIFTCYPFDNIGHAYQRYIVYAELIKE